MIECPEYTLTLPPPCPTSRDRLSLHRPPTDFQNRNEESLAKES